MLGVLHAEEKQKEKKNRGTIEYVSKKVSKEIIPGQQDGSAAKGTCHTSLATQVNLQNYIKVGGGRASPLSSQHGRTRVPTYTPHTHPCTQATLLDFS